MKRFRTFFLVAGVPFSLLLALFLRGSLLGMIAGILIGAVYGLIMASVAYVFTKRIGFSGRTRFLLIGIMSITGLIGGVVLAFGVGLVSDWLFVGEWTQIPSPPEKPVEILAADSVAWVQTIEGSIYACSTLAPYCAARDEPSPKDIRPGVCRDDLHPRMPPAPGKAVDSYECEVSETQGVQVQYNWLILEDGSIWYWIKEETGQALLAVLLGPTGLLVGLRVSLFIVGKKW